MAEERKQPALTEEHCCWHSGQQQEGRGGGRPLRVCASAVRGRRIQEREQKKEPIGRAGQGCKQRGYCCYAMLCCCFWPNAAGQADKWQLEGGGFLIRRELWRKWLQAQAAKTQRGWEQQQKGKEKMPFGLGGHNAPYGTCVACPCPTLLLCCCRFLLSIWHTHLSTSTILSLASFRPSFVPPPPSQCLCSKKTLNKLV